MPAGSLPPEALAAFRAIVLTGDIPRELAFEDLVTG
jgi:hypothetical protein